MGTLVEHIPPQRKLYKLDYTRHRIYLAGSVCGGDWQRYFINRLTGLDIDIFNPRSSNMEGLFGWEIDHLNIANIIALHFDPTDRSPSGLLTLGMFAKTNRLMVCCPSTYQYKSDVDIVCEREDIQQVDTLDLLIENTIARVSPRKYRYEIANIA